MMEVSARSALMAVIVLMLIFLLFPMLMGVGMMGMMMGPWGAFSLFAFPFLGFVSAAFLMLATFLALGIVVTRLVFPPRLKQVRNRRLSALDVLKERYVGGEIGIEEFERELKKLGPQDLESGP